MPGMDETKKTITKTRVEGLVIFLLALGYLWEAHNVPSLFQMPGVPGPTVFPFLLGIVLMGSGLWLILFPENFWFKKKGREPKEIEEKSALPPGINLGKELTRKWHFVTMWVVLFGYLLAMPLLGFPLATALLLATFFFLLGEKRWYVGIGLSLMVTILIFFCFAKGLAIRLPLGILDRLWP